jgi:DNA-binding CsgD family transcriptional regulator
MVTVEEFSRLVSGIYAAAVTPECWESTVGAIARTLGGTECALLEADGVSRRGRASMLPLEARDSYASYYCHMDYMLAELEKGPVGAVRTWTELVEPHKRRSEFYADWLRHRDLSDGLFVRLTPGPRPASFLVGAASRSESFDTPERVKLTSGLVVHLQQALRTEDKLADLARSSTDLAAALEVVRHGILIVASGCWVMNLNMAAERILRAADGLQVRSGRIAATSASAERKLYRAIHLALTDEGSDVRSGHSFTCGRPSGRRPYIIHVLPLHHGEADETSRRATALVLIVDPEHDPEPPAALLRRLYNLTTTEAEVALRVSRGTGLKQIAEDLSITFTTVRTHLQHVFDKTDTHRQPELVRLLLTLTP